MDRRRMTWVWANSLKDGRCSSGRCGRPIVWAINCTSGKFMPFDAPLRAERTELREVKPGVHHQAMQVDLDTNHFASCPDRARYARSKGR